MRRITRFTWMAAVLLLIVLSLPDGARAYSPVEGTARLAPSTIPAPCMIDPPNAYLVVEKTRRHILDWDTFLNLGFKSSDIVPCGDAARYPEGAPVTRLIKGSADAVYWMRDGFRRHIQDMQTFNSLGFRVNNISVLPDAMVSAWPLGDPISSVSEQATPTNGPTQRAPLVIPAPCMINSPDVYLIVDRTRRHINDWDTFLGLGFKSSDIVPCGDAANYPEGAPIDRLIKGSADAVYWMDGGYRRYVSAMGSLRAHGFLPDSVSVLPESFVLAWPLGTPLDRTIQQFSLGGYSVQWAKDELGHSFVTISAPGQPDVVIQDVEAIGKLPAADITGDGHPDIQFLTNGYYSSGCCAGTVVYDLGAVPTRVMDFYAIAKLGSETGRGDFVDLDGDGIYEFITHEPAVGHLCPTSYFPAILRYRPAGHDYVPASRQFPAYYQAVIDKLSANPATRCEAVTVLLFVDRVEQAKALFDSLYARTDAAGDWPGLQGQVKQDRFYGK